MTAPDRSVDLHRLEADLSGVVLLVGSVVALGLPFVYDKARYDAGPPAPVSAWHTIFYRLPKPTQAQPLLHLAPLVVLVASVGSLLLLRAGRVARRVVIALSVLQFVLVVLAAGAANSEVLVRGNLVSVTGPGAGTLVLALLAVGWIAQAIRLNRTGGVSGD